MVVYITEKSMWAGPTRGLWFFVRGACGRDPPRGGALLKNVLHNPVGLGESYTLHSQMISPVAEVNSHITGLLTMSALQ